MGLLLCVMSLLGADLFQDTFAEGNGAYQQGVYGDAVAAYERLVDSGVVDSAVFYNLGNSYFQAGDLGGAVANYERALQVAPGHILASENLGLVLKATERNLAKPGGRAWEETFLFWDDGLSKAMVWRLCILCWFLCWGCLIMRSWRGLAYGRSLAVILGIVAMFMGLSVYAKTWPAVYAVARDEAVAVRFGKDTRQAIRFELFAGDRVLIDGEDGDWLRVMTVDKERGWVEASSMVVVGPPYSGFSDVVVDEAGREKDGIE